jgi:hypothetical protein
MPETETHKCCYFANRISKNDHVDDDIDENNNKSTKVKKVKLSPQQAVEAYRVVRC